MAVKISIVIPTFRRPALLQQCLSMLVIQDFDKTAYEIIVVADGPDKETENEVSRYRSAGKDSPAVRYYHLPVKKGPAAARNLGWQKAGGRLIAFTDDDCIPHICWLKVIWNAYHQQQEIAFTGRVIVPRRLRPTDHERNVSRLEEAEFVTANCFCTRGALERVNGFDERFSVAWREDSDLEFNLINRHIPVQHIQEARIIHPVRRSSWGVSLREQKKSMYNALLYKKHPLLYRSRIQASPPWHYYGIILSFLLFLGCILFFRSSLVGTLSLLIWLGLTGRFMYKRIAGNSCSGNHIMEMIVTSLFIPFLSVFWRLFGSFKYKIFFL